MKKVICLILTLALLAISLASCTHRVDVPDKEGELTVTVRDESGLHVGGVTVDICEGSRTVATVTTEGDGRARVTLLYGEYTLKISSLPEGFEKINGKTVINFTEASKSHAVTVRNTVGLGTERSPYVISGDTVISLEAGGSAYYLIKPTDKNTLYIPNAPSLSIKLDGATVHTNSRGNIYYTAEGEALVLITNSGAKINAPAQLVYPFGSEKNPYTATLGMLYTSTLNDRTVHYTFTAENGGSYILRGISGEGVYSLSVNGGEPVVTTGTQSITVELSAGDSLIFTVSGTGSATYSLSAAGSTELPFQPLE